MEDELQTYQMHWGVEREELVAELDRLRDVYEQQQRLLAANLSKSPQSQNEAFMHHEISRLSSDNLVSIRRLHGKSKEGFTSRQS